MSIAANVRTLRNQRGLTQKELADRAGLSHRTIVAVETTMRHFSPPTIRALAKAFNISPSDIDAHLDASGCPPLTDKQQRMLDFIRAYKTRHGLAPSLRDIGEAMGISSTSVVTYNLKRLEDARKLRLLGNFKSRAIVLLEETDPAANLRAVIQEAAADIEELAEYAYVLEPAELFAAIRARAEGLRAALETAGVSL